MAVVEMMVTSANRTGYKKREGKETRAEVRKERRGAMGGQRR